MFIVDKISVIVPCFNEEDVLPLFYQEVTKVLESIENTTYELLFINDDNNIINNERSLFHNIFLFFVSKSFVFLNTALHIAS